MRDPALVERLERMLKEGDEEERWGAATAMGALGLAQCEASLIKALSDPSMRVRSGTIWALGFVGGPAGVKALIGVLLNTGERRDVRRDAAMALGDLLRRTTHRPYGKALSLEESLLHRVEDALLSVASDREDWPDVRIEALNALSAFGKRRCRLFARIVRDGGDRIDVRVAACRCLGRAWARPAVAAIREALHSPYPMLRLAALEALYEAQPPDEQKEALRDDVAACASDTEPAVREQATLLLADWSDERLAGRESARKGFSALTNGLLVYRGVVDPASQRAGEVVAHSVPEVRELGVLGRFWDALGTGQMQHAKAILDDIIREADEETLRHLLDFLEEGAGESEQERALFVEAAVAIALDGRRSVDLRLEAARKVAPHLPEQKRVAFVEIAGRGGWETAVAAVALGKSATTLLKDQIQRTIMSKTPSLNAMLAPFVSDAALLWSDPLILEVGRLQRGEPPKIESLFDSDWRVRNIAARAILKNPPSVSSPPQRLEVLLEDDDPYVVAAAVTLLARSGGEAIRRRALALLGSADSAVVVRAVARALGLSADLVRVCGKVLVEGRAAVRVALLEALVELGRRRPLWREAVAMGLVEVVRQTLQAVEEDVRLAGVGAAAQLLQLDALAQLLYDASPRVSRAALDSMQEVVLEAGAVSALPEDVREKAAEILAARAAEYPQEADEREMEGCVRVLARLAPHRLPEVLRKLHPHLRGTLLKEVLEALGGVDASLLHGEWLLRLVERAVLGRVGVEAALGVLVRVRPEEGVSFARDVLLGGGDGAEGAARVLFKMNNEAANKVLREALFSVLPDVRLAVLRAAGEDLPKRVDWLVEALWDGDFRVRGEAVELLKNLPERVLLEALQKALNRKGSPPPHPDKVLTELLSRLKEGGLSPPDKRGR